MDTGFSPIRTKEKLEIAVSTETILYLPFYIAYYNKDFRNTPFSELEVVIIGTENDFRFIHAEKLKGDGFATFAVLLGLADAAICDPSFLIYLNHCDDEILKDELKKFQSYLTDTTKSAITKRQYDEHISQSLKVDKNGGELVFENLGLFKEKVLKQHTKVIGGLISKIAFSAVGSEDLVLKSNNDKNIGRFYKDGGQYTTFGKDNLQNLFIHYPPPSTGFYIGQLYFNGYKNENSTIAFEEADFGSELKKLTKKNNSNFCPQSVAFSCDYTSIDFYLEKHNKGVGKKLIEIENLAFDSSNNFMFTGILGNTKPQNLEKLKALLYGIDYNLFKIHSYIKKDDSTGLIEFLKTKLKYSKDKQNELLNLLVADSEVKSQIENLINDQNSSYQFETVLKYFVDRLLSWSQTGKSLYYPNTSPNSKDLESLTLLRYKLNNSPPKINYNHFVQEDLLNDFREKERKYWKLEGFALKSKWLKRRWLLFAPVLVVLYIIQWFIQWILKWETLKFSFLETMVYYIGELTTFFEKSIWIDVRKPIILYFLGSLFIVLEIISSLFHIFHMPKHELYEWYYPLESPKNIPFINITFEKILFGSILLWGTIVYIISIFFSFRKLLMLKQESQFFYRNE